jgi:hypothetical protein
VSLSASLKDKVLETLIREVGGIPRKKQNPHIPSHPSPKRIMKKQYMKVKQSKKNYSTTLFTAEANVDMGIESTRPNVEVKGVEIIDGKKFLVLKV